MDYGSLWWAIVYAAQPSYRAKRKNEVLRASLIELEAERAAIAHCQEIGLLDKE